MSASNLLSIPFIAIFVGLVSQLNFLVNAEVVNGGWLTVIGIVVGCLVSFLIGFARHRAKDADRLTVSYPYQVRWFNRIVNWPLIVVMAVFGSMIGVSLLNRAGSAGPSATNEYTVAGFGSQRAGSNRKHYVGLTDGVHSLKYMCHEATCAKLRVGQPVKVTLNRGLLGFSYIGAIAPGAGNPGNW